MNSVVKNLKLEKKTKDFAWYKEKFDAGLLCVNGEKFNELTFETFRLSIKCTKEIYDDNWDVDINLSGESVDIKGIVLHFPDYMIRNSRNKSHNIKDLFVRIPFIIGNGRLKIDRVEGGRTTFSYAEYCSNYVHSHLTGRRIRETEEAPYFSSFCTGSGNINIFQVNINSDGFTEENFTQFLLAIVTLVNWESLEGTPYQKFENIRERSQDNIYYYSQSYAVKFVTHILHKLRTSPFDSILFPLDIYTETDGYKIRNNEKFEDFLMQFPLSDSQKKEVLCFMTSSGTAYKYTQSLSLHHDIPVFTDAKSYVFNGKTYKPTILIETPTKEEEKNIKFNLHPNVKEFAKKELEYELNKTTIRESTINRYKDQIDNAKESITTDPISV